MNIEQKAPTEGKQLIVREEFLEVFEIVSAENCSFAALGRYKITPDFDTAEEAKNYIEDPKNLWKNILTVITSYYDAIYTSKLGDQTPATNMGNNNDSSNSSVDSAIVS